MKIQLTNKREVFNFCKPYVIAELGSNHNGDMELAKKLILEAKETGADCVKFQSWSKDTLFSRKKFEDNFFIEDDYRDRSDYTLEEIVDAYSISEKELLKMKKFATELDMDFTSTPFSKKEVDFLIDQLESPFIKVASMDVNNYPFLEYLSKKNKPIVLSTGLSELYEIDKAIKTIEKTGNTQIVILHCVASYPPIDTDVNLNNIKTLMATYPNYPIGFSDHTLGTAIPVASVALGVCLIEKHFTLDKNMEGWDHKVSATKDEMKEIVENASRVSQAMGSFRITATESNDKKREFRRSIVLTRGINKGEIITEEMIDFKRPGTGIPPEAVSYIIGKKVNRNIAYDEIINLEDF
jgi:sialic acid synthase SpsE